MLMKFQQITNINKSITISMGKFGDSPNSFLCFTTNSKRIYMVLLGGANTQCSWNCLEHKAKQDSKQVHQKICIK